MSTAEYSSLAIVASFVIYILALVAHSAEWASIRGVSLKSEADAAGGDDLDPVRVRSDMWGRLGVILTGLGAACHGIGVVLRGIAADRMPWGNMYEFVITALFFAVVLYLVGVWRWNLRWLGLPVSLLMAVGNGLAVTVFYVDVAPLVPALHSVWFIIHIVAACISAAAFNLGAAAAILYLVKRRAILKAEQRATDDADPGNEIDGGAGVVRTGDRSPDRAPATSADELEQEWAGTVATTTKRTSGEPVLKGFLARMPSLASIDRLSYRAHAFAFPVWTFTIAAGAVWAEYAWGRFWGWDPKETWSLVTWVIYAAYLHARATAGWKGRNAAIIAIVGVASFWFNFIGINLLVSGLHSYAGI
ncbi:c-type cytochrome biogenesis protein CcsB [Propionibacteriaceae bacterium Y1923]